jgi:hypothetical protein
LKAIVNNLNNLAGTWSIACKPAWHGAFDGAPRSRAAERQAGEYCCCDTMLSTMALGFGAQF